MLRITLRDGEKAIINGAVLHAVGRVQLSIENRAAILRGRDVMRAEDATTPARQLYFATMLAYIDPEDREAHQETIVARLSETLASADTTVAKAACVRFAHDAARGDFYRALAAARDLIAFEAEAEAAPEAPRAA